MLKNQIECLDFNIEIWNMPLNREISSFSDFIELEDIRKFYFEHTKRTLRIEDAKYLLERATELEITKKNGGVQALFSTLKYNFNQEGSDKLSA